MLGSLANRMDLEPFIGEVDHNKVLVNVAAHEHLALHGINGNPLNVGKRPRDRLRALARASSCRPATFNLSVLVIGALYIGSPSVRACAGHIGDRRAIRQSSLVPGSVQDRPWPLPQPSCGS